MVEIRAEERFEFGNRPRASWRMDPRMQSDSSEPLVNLRTRRLRSAYPSPMPGGGEGASMVMKRPADPPKATVGRLLSICALVDIAESGIGTFSSEELAEAAGVSFGEGSQGPHCPLAPTGRVASATTSPT